jgi:hypothetical protein
LATLSISPCLRYAFSILLVAWLTGCTTYVQRAQTVRQANQAGDYEMAATVSLAQAEWSANDALIWKLEAASALRAQGKLAESAKVLEEVELLLRAEEERPDFSVSGETLSAFTNDYSSAYRAKPQDRLYASTYQALNRLELGQGAAARVALARLRFVQETFGNGELYVRAPTKGKADAKYDVEKASRDERTRLTLGVVEEDVATLSRDGKYDDAFSHWLQGMFFLRLGADAADREKARKELLAATQLNPQCTAFAADLKECEGAVPAPRVVYVVMETGLAPEWYEQRVDIPVFVASSNLPYVSIALPALRPSWNDYNLRLQLEGKEQVVSPASRTDALIAKHFGAALPAVKARAFTSAAVKAAAAYALNRAAAENARRNNDSSGNLLRVLTQVGTAVYTVGTTRADVRNWTGLPARFSLARWEVSAGGKLTVPGHPEATLVLPAGRVLLVTLKSSAENNPIQARCTILVP